MGSNDYYNSGQISHVGLRVALNSSLHKSRKKVYNITLSLIHYNIERLGDNMTSIFLQVFVQESKQKQQVLSHPQLDNMERGKDDKVVIQTQKYKIERLEDQNKDLAEENKKLKRKVEKISKERDDLEDQNLFLDWKIKKVMKNQQN